MLEIGTGSGYQTALLTRLAKHVYSVERHAELARQATDNMSRLGLTNFTVVTGDGSRGLPECAPFDAIIVSAAATPIPSALFEQLREGGRMIIPVGPPEAQELQLVRKQGGKALIVLREGCRLFRSSAGGSGLRCKIKSKLKVKGRGRGRPLHTGCALQFWSASAAQFAGH